MPSKPKSPAKQLRSIKRLFSFNKMRCNVRILSINSCETTSIFPTKPKLSITNLVSLNLIPTTPKLSFAKTSVQSISPRPIYHPAIINASIAMHQKHPTLLSPEELIKFNMYIRYKIDRGQPIEEELMYLPSGGVRNCLQCGHLTWCSKLFSGFPPQSYPRRFLPDVL